MRVSHSRPRILRTSHKDCQSSDISAVPAHVCPWHIASFRCAAELGRYRGIADLSRTLRLPCNCQPRIFSHQISSISAVARSRHLRTCNSDSLSIHRTLRTSRCVLPSFQHSLPLDIFQRIFERGSGRHPVRFLRLLRRTGEFRCVSGACLWWPPRRGQSEGVPIQTTADSLQPGLLSAWRARRAGAREI